MPLSTLRPKPPRRTSVATEEERAWISFYRRVGHDSALADEVLAQLDADGEMKRMHLALYLSCRESLRMYAERERRNARIGLFVRGVFHAVFVAMPAAAGRKLKRSGNLAVACLPEVNAEPAHAQVGRLTSEPPFEAARRAFEASAPAVASRSRTGLPPAAAEPTQVRAAE
jgi:hypothetical protein